MGHNVCIIDILQLKTRINKECNVFRIKVANTIAFCDRKSDCNN